MRLVVPACKNAQAGRMARFAGKDSSWSLGPRPGAGRGRFTRQDPCERVFLKLRN